jgi:hypothetical protein
MTSQEYNEEQPNFGESREKHPDPQQIHFKI